MRLFDRIIIVDWSASTRPKLGRDSIWIGIHTKDAAQQKNLPTRAAARDFLEKLLSDSVDHDVRTLVGFDFPLGFPSGFASYIGSKGANWKTVWQALSSKMKDGPANANNRFEVANALNESISGEPYPFWGLPKNQRHKFLSSRKSTTLRLLEDFRHTDKRAKGAHSIWKLYYSGCVGSQALTGIPVASYLRYHSYLKDHCMVWPFEDGFHAPLKQSKIVIAEVFPSLLQPLLGKPWNKKTRDKEQVRDLAKHYFQLDQDGHLRQLFAGPRNLSVDELRTAVTEEGWILPINDSKLCLRV
jgi:hypothetical protein